jgi:hypothetical protein
LRTSSGSTPSSMHRILGWHIRAAAGIHANWHGISPRVSHLRRGCRKLRKHVRGPRHLRGTPAAKSYPATSLRIGATCAKARGWLSGDLYDV